MRISPRFIWTTLLACSISACSSFDTPPRFAGSTAPANTFAHASERLRDEIRDYLQEEDRWIPRGRDISLWQSAEMLAASGRNLTNGLTNSKITPQELDMLIGSATRRLHDLDYWTANVRINKTILGSLSDAHSSLAALHRSSRATYLEQSAPRPRKSSRRTSFFSPPAPFSPNDLNGAVTIAKSYLQMKYALNKDAFGNMRARELSNNHEVTLETRQTSYVLLVDTRKGVVVKEKSAPKIGRHTVVIR